MRAEDDNFIRLLVAADFADNVFLFDRPADFIGHVEARTQFPRISSDGTRKPQGVFARDDCLWDFVDLSIESVCMPVEQQPLPCAHPENG